MSYVAFLLGMFLLYWIAACGCSLTWRIHGIPILCSSAVMGVGAYTAAWFGHVGMPPVADVALATIVGGSVGFGFGVLIARFPRDVATVVAIALQAVCTLGFLNLTSVTGGPMGYGGVAPLLLRQDLLGIWWPVGTIIIIAIPTLWFVSRLFRGPFGAAARAAGENETLLNSLGISPGGVTVRVLIVTCVLFSLAGALFAHCMSFIHPDNFTLDESMLLLCMVVLGRRTNIWWTGSGVAVLLLMPEALRAFQIDAASGAKVRNILLGAALTLAAVGLARTTRRSIEA